MTTPYRSVYMTFPDEPSAMRVAQALVLERLAACVNVLPAGFSVYRWEGAVQHEPELVAFAKTRADLVPEVVRRVTELHPYDVPAVLALPIDDGAAPYLAWLEGELTDGAANGATNGDTDEGADERAHGSAVDTAVASADEAANGSGRERP